MGLKGLAYQASTGRNTGVTTKNITSENNTTRRNINENDGYNTIGVKNNNMIHEPMLVVIKLPYLKSTMLCSKLSKGMGHNYYGEPA